MRDDAFNRYAKHNELAIDYFKYDTQHLYFDGKQLYLKKKNHTNIELPKCVHVSTTDSFSNARTWVFIASVKLGASFGAGSSCRDSLGQCHCRDDLAVSEHAIIKCIRTKISLTYV